MVYVGIVALCIKVFEKGLAWATDKWLQIISNVYNSYATREQRNKAILSVKQYWMCCYVVLSNIRDVKLFL